MEAKLELNMFEDAFQPSTDPNNLVYAMISTVLLYNKRIKYAEIWAAIWTCKTFGTT